MGVSFLESLFFGGCGSMVGPFGGYGLGSINTDNLSNREAYLALSNGADGRKGHCAYCGNRATWLDGKSCPSCGAKQVEWRYDH